MPHKNSEKVKQARKLIKQTLPFLVVPIVLALVAFGIWRSASTAQKEREERERTAATQTPQAQTPPDSGTPNQANAAQTAPASDAPQLLCGEGEITPELAQEVIFTIPPGNCWTIWVVKPNGASRLWAAPEGDTWVEFEYEDGSKSGPILDSPIKRTVLPKAARKVRFMAGTNPVRVRIQLQ